MKNIIILLVLLLGFNAQTALAPQLKNEPQIRYKIKVPNNVTATQVRNVVNMLNKYEFDIAGINEAQRTIEVITTTKGLSFLKEKGFDGQMVRTDFSPDQRFLNPTTLTSKLSALNQAYPQLSRVIELGKSNQGRPVLAMLVSTTLDYNSAEYFQKPTIIIDGLHHAREIMTPEVVFDVAETVLKNAQTPQGQEILKNWNIWVIPMLNPDGSNIVWTSNSMWRKNARSSLDGVHGVDINRNYNYRWGECNGSSGSQGSDTYRGATAASEPEVKAFNTLTDHVRPTAYLSYHSYSELVLHPYGCYGDLTSENALIKKVANELASLLPRDDGRGNYKPGAPWEILYGVDGSSMDFMYAAYGTLSYTFEVNQDFHPSYSLREPTLLKHRKAWTYFMNRSGKNMLKVQVVDGLNQLQRAPLVAAIAVDKIKHLKKEMPLRTNNFGVFFKVLDPGEYIVSAKLADGRVGMTKVVMQNQPQTISIVIK
ncbi:MAG: hypothetical protein IPM57_12090 [Oligoflexia bacterium]|nr:hypothetical protein [Oligoflexia bacterium]